MENTLVVTSPCAAQLSFYDSPTGDLLADSWFSIGDCFSELEGQVNSYLVQELQKTLTSTDLIVLVTGTSGYGYFEIDESENLFSLFKKTQFFLEFEDRLRAVSTEIDDLETALDCVGQVRGPFANFNHYVDEIIESYDQVEIPDFLIEYFDYDRFRQELTWAGFKELIWADQVYIWEQY